jgi:hypothetical protein
VLNMRHLRNLWIDCEVLNTDFYGSSTDDIDYVERCADWTDYATSAFEKLKLIRL